MALVIIPATLREFCAGDSKVEAEGANVEAVLRAVDAQCPGFYARVVDGHRLRPELAFALNGEVISLALHDAVPPGTEIAIVPAIGGGGL